MQIKSIEKNLEHYIWNICREESLYEAFPKLQSTEGHMCGYSIPAWVARDGIIWLWLKWHQTKNISEIREFLKPIIERAIQANNDNNAFQRLREDHDNFLIQLAVLAGDKELIKTVCDSVQEADPKSDEHQYTQAWTGILKYRILGIQEKVLEQHRIMQKWKPLRIYLWPNRKLVETFVERNYKEFNKALKRSCERQWIWAERDRALLRKPDGSLVLDVEKRYSYFMWPWVEGAFAKLAYMDGAEIKYDSFWLPLDLVKAIEEAQFCSSR